VYSLFSSLIEGLVKGVSEIGMISISLALCDFLRVSSKEGERFPSIKY